MQWILLNVLYKNYDLCGKSSMVEMPQDSLSIIEYVKVKFFITC